MFGNLLNYAILYGGKTPLPNDEDNEISTSVTPTKRDLSICGRFDCQDPNVTDQNLNRYEPASKVLIDILIGVTAGLVMIAMLVQIFFIKPIDPSKEALLEKSDKEKEAEMSSDNKVSNFYW